MERHISLLRNHRRLKALKRQLKLGFALYLGFINLRMRMLHCYLKAETKTSPATFKVEFNLFGELTYGFIFLNFCGCVSKDCLEIQTVTVVLLQ